MENMKTMIRGEFQKLVSWKKAWIITLLIVLLNSVFIIEQLRAVTDDGYTLQEKQLVFWELLELESEQIEAKIEILREELQQKVQNDTYQGDDSNEFYITRQIFGEISEARNYEAYLKQVFSQARLMELSNLAGNDTYAKSAAKLIRQQYTKLENIEVTPVFSDGIRMVFENPLTDVFLFMIIVFWVICLFMKEYEDGNWQYIRIMPNGTAKFIIAKLITLYLLVVIGTALFYGINLIIAETLLPSGFWDMPIQGVYGYTGCAYAINGAEFFSLFLGIKIAGFWIIVSLILFFCVYFQEYIRVIAGLAVVFGIEGILYYAIGEFSTYAFWKKINLFMVLDTDIFFQGYPLIELFGYAVGRLFIYLGILFLLMFLLNCASVIVWKRSKKTEKQKKIFLWKKLLWKKEDHSFSVSLFRQEGYKLYKLTKGSVLLLVLIAFQVYSLTGYYFYTDEETFYYQLFSKELCSLAEQEQENYIIQESAKIQERENLIEEYNQLYAKGEISLEELQVYIEAHQVPAAKKNALDHVTEQFAVVKETKANGYDTKYIDQTGWERMLGYKGQEENLKYFVLLQLMLIFILSEYYTMDYKNCMHELMCIYPKGKWMSAHRLLQGVLYAVISGCIMIIPHYIRIGMHYNLGDFGISVKSIMSFDPGLEMSIFARVVLDICFWVGMSAIQVVLLAWISRKTKNKLAVLLLGSIVLILNVLIL